MTIAAGLDPDLLQRQTFLVDHLECLALRQHTGDTRVVLFIQQARLTREQALGATEQVTHGLVRLGHFLLDQRRDHQLAVLRHDLKAVVEDGHGGVHVQIALAFDAMGDGRYTLHLSQAEEAEQLDPGPAHVELPLLHRQLGAVGVGVVVVVQFFTADQDAPGHQIGGSVAAFEVAVADSMAKTVDDACGPHRNPHHLDRPDGDASHTEQGQIDDRHQGHTTNRVAAVDIALNPVVRAVLAVDAQRLLILRLFLIEFGTFAQHGAQPLDNRTVWVIDGFALGMMLAVDGRPLTGVLAGGQPQPEAEEMLECRMQLQRTVRGVAVQVDGDADDGDMRHQQSDCHQLPDRQVE